MSVYVNNSGTLDPIAGNGILNTFTGTTAEVQAAIQSGAITNGMVVYITDDGSNESAINVGYDNTESQLEADNVQDAIDEVKSALSDKVGCMNVASPITITVTNRQFTATQNMWVVLLGASSTTDGYGALISVNNVDIVKINSTYIQSCIFPVKSGQTVTFNQYVTYQDIKGYPFL